jgi:YHS domain-containing protein
VKNLIVICLALAFFSGAGCGNKPEKQETPATTQAGAARMVSLMDPVDKSKIKNFKEAKYPYVYEGVEYRFNSKEHYEAFKKDPSKYVSK